jgi:hypothetical protein
MIVKFPPVNNDREAFDFIIEHLKRQDCKSMLRPESRSGCMYRVEEYRNVLKCAVGALISVNDYAPHLEDQTIQFDGEVYDAIRNSNPHWIVTQNSVEILQSLQRLHDEVEVNDWSWLFRVIDWAIEEFGFESIVYSPGHSRSALYSIVSMAQNHIKEKDTRLGEWNFSETTMEWFSDKREKAMAMA